MAGSTYRNVLATRKLNVAPAMVFKLVKAAWRRLDGHALLPKLILSVKFSTGPNFVARKADPQPALAAA